MSQNTEPFDELPEALIRRLRQREQSVSQLTPAVDRAVLDAARAQFGGRRAPAPARRRWYYPAAAAAAVALAALLITQPFEQAGIEALRTADDIDGSGRIDILDVHALARARAGDPNAVSQGRIDALAERIVALNATVPVL